MAEEIYAEEGNKQVRRGLSLSEYSVKDYNTIYKLTLSMKKRFSPQEGTSETTSPVEAGEVRNLLNRLVEIDNESRVLLSKVFSLLAKDETLEDYVKKRIEDPKVSKMWQLVEQVLAFQEGELNVKDMIMDDDDDDDSSDYVINEKGIKEKDEPETEKKNDRFKVKNIGSGGGVQAGATSSGSSAGAASTKTAGSSSASTNNKTGGAK